MNIGENVIGERGRAYDYDIPEEYLASYSSSSLSKFEVGFDEFDTDKN